MLQMTSKVQDWYCSAYPTDDLGPDLDPQTTFSEVLQTLIGHQDVYEILGQGDSLVRERVFGQLAKLLGVDYNYIYDLWLGK